MRSDVPQVSGMDDLEMPEVLPRSFVDGFVTRSDGHVRNYPGSSHGLPCLSRRLRSSAQPQHRSSGSAPISNGGRSSSRNSALPWVQQQSATSSTNSKFNPNADLQQRPDPQQQRGTSTAPMSSGGNRSYATSQRSSSYTSSSKTRGAQAPHQLGEGRLGDRARLS